MTDHPRDAHFLASIRASPADDLPRLAWCDWLEETAGWVRCPKCKGTGVCLFIACPACKVNDPTSLNGERGTGRASDGRRERAEFCRVQCERNRRELAHLPADDPCTCHNITFGTADYCGACQRRSTPLIDLRRRERELLVAHGCGWFAPADGWAVSAVAVLDSEVPGVVVRRGFVAEVRTTLTDWCGGGECGRCRGDGHFLNWDMASDTTRRGHDCPACDGTGRTIGIGPAVVSEHPVERVVLTDREPGEDNGGWFWREMRGGGYFPSDIPPEVFAADPRSMSALHPHRDAALDALSAALILHAKSQTPEAK